MTKKTWIIFVAVCTVMFVGLYFYSKKDSVDVSKVDGTQINQGMPESGGLKDSVSGNINAKVTLIEYGDYQLSLIHI